MRQQHRTDELDTDPYDTGERALVERQRAVIDRQRAVIAELVDTADELERIGYARAAALVRDRARYRASKSMLAEVRVDP